MLIKDITYINFRNLKDTTLSFSPKTNLFYGKNGQGKTNLLEAIYFAGTGKSFKTKKNSETIKYKKTKNGVSVTFSDYISEKRAIVKLIDGKRIFSLNGKNVPYDEYYGRLTIISYIPEDVSIINSGPVLRRDFFDSEIAQANSDFFHYMKDFNNLLKIRNKYLKERNYKADEFEIYQDKFIKTSALIIKLRLEYTKMLSALLSLNYRKLFDEDDELYLQYSCHLGDMRKKSLIEIEQIIKNEIKEKFNQEIKYGFSLVGPQKDDFIFILNSYDAKTSASQGEKKSIIFSLKMAEIDMMIRDRKENPILIIDDVTSYFDNNRLNSVLEYLDKRNIQIFLSGVEKIGETFEYYYVKNGDIIHE